MGPPQPTPPHGLCSSASSWPWGGAIGDKQSVPELKLDRMEGLDGGGGGGGLRFFLHFDPAKVDRTLLGVSLSALLSRVLGWTATTSAGQRRGAMAAAITDDAAAVSAAAALAAAVSVCLAAMHAARHRPRLLPRRLPRPSSAAASRRRAALPAPHEGLRILSSKDESSENVIHGASIGAGDDDDEQPVIVARVEMTTARADNTPIGANAETTAREGGQPEEEELERREHERRLRELWLSLVEREQRLELRLQELEGLRELESRTAAAATEARLLELRTASLQDENGRLRTQLEELDDARAGLARAKEKLHAIKARVQAEREESRREEAALRARVAELESCGRGGSEEEERVAALEAKAAALRQANAALEEENMELALRLQDAQQAAASAHLALEADMVEEARQLREANERLVQQIEEMRGDHCAHVEELVYLKWVNACLRHELSDDQQHGHILEARGGGASAMELSKSMSYRSSERAKQLMLRYGHPGLDEPAALFSPLHESVDGDNDARSPVTSAATAPALGKTKPGHRKNKFLGNIKKLLPGGKKSHSSHGGGGRESGREAPAPRDEYLEKAMQWLSTHDVLDFDHHSYESTPLSSSSCAPSSVTTATTTRGPAAAAEEGTTTTLPRSKSDAGASYGREAGRYYHSLRPDHPADETGVVAPPPEKRELRRRSEEVLSLMRSPGASRA